MTEPTAKQEAKYICSIHGDVSRVTLSVILEKFSKYNGEYCLVCLFDKMQAQGFLHRVHEVGAELLND